MLSFREREGAATGRNSSGADSRLTRSSPSGQVFFVWRVARHGSQIKELSKRVHGAPRLFLEKREQTQSLGRITVNYRAQWRHAEQFYWLGIMRDRTAAPMFKARLKQT
jgi:hypothetical protein